jgi:phage tail tape-measure protein
LNYEAMMKNLIVGRFTQQTHAETTAQALQRDGFAASEMSQFFVNPQGQHNLNVLGGEVEESVATEDASSTSLGGAVGGIGAGALLGVATIPVLGPAGPLLGAAVGAYTGSLVGALKGMDDIDPQDPTAPQHAGVLLAVAVATDDEEARALNIMGTYAVELQHATGELHNGDWVDFNPLAPTHAIKR